MSNPINTPAKTATTVSPAEMAAAAGTKAANNTVEVKTEQVKPVAPTAVVLTTAETDSQNIIQFKKLLDKFVEVRNGTRDIQRVNNRDIRFAERSIMAFRNIVNFTLLNQNDIKVLNLLRQFFVQHREGILSGENGMQGMDVISSEVEQNRISIVWALMYELTSPNRTRSTFDLEHAAKVCTNQQCPNPNGFVQYVASRLK